MSNSSATGALLTALGKFAADHANTTVTGTGPVLFTACA
jgi:hypothetical protein